jgi:hypothetical protein
MLPGPIFAGGPYLCSQISWMMPKPALASRFIALLLLLIVQTASAQYFYKDILSLRESVEQQQRYSQNKVRDVLIQSFDPDGTENKDFFCRQSVSADYTRLETESGSIATGKSTLTTIFAPAPGTRVLRSEDSSRDAITTTTYTYDAAGNVSAINSISTTADTSTTDTTNFISGEQHIWQYTPAGQPDRMLRIKEGGDTTLVRFQLDTLGNVTDEIAVRNGAAAEHYYYYYDENHRLTDIVRYNPKMKQMLPDYMFEYDANTGKLSKMTVVQAINSSYLVWYYEYDPDGLRTKEFCYDKTKQLIGTIGYTYRE